MAELNPYDEAMTVELAAEARQSRIEMVHELELFVAALSSKISEDFSAKLIPGHATDIGQIMDVVIQGGESFRQVLVRAYVPAYGVPTQLDLYDADLTPCYTPQEMRDQLLKLAKHSVVKELLLNFGKTSDTTTGENQP